MSNIAESRRVLNFIGLNKNFVLGIWSYIIMFKLLTCNNYIMTPGKNRENTI